MTVYKEPIVMDAYQFNNATLLINDEHEGVMLQSFSAEHINDTSAITESDDGIAILEIYPTRSGIFRITTKRGSPTNGKLWDLFAAGTPFKISFADKNTEDLKASGVQCWPQKPPMTGRSKSVEDVEWVMLTPYLTCRDGGFKLAA